MLFPHAGTLSGLIALTLAAASTLAQAQGQDPKASINDAISDAVQQGTTPYRPVPPSEQAGSLGNLDAECQDLADQIAAAPKREYHTTKPTVENAQGSMLPEVARERPKKDLQKAYRDKCATQQ